MAGTIYSGTYTSTIVLNNPATQRPVTVTGEITAATGPGIFGNFLFDWTVDNRGTIQATGTSGLGINFAEGGTVNNLVAGSVSPGGVSGAALIAGYSVGVLISAAPGTVNNLGQIEGTGTNGTGILMDAGGNITNGSAGDTTALINGGVFGIDVNGGAGNISNFGSIASTVSGNSVRLTDGGSVTNGSAASTAALISSAGAHTGVYVDGGAGAVTNFGAIEGGGVGIFLGDGGRVTNGSLTSTAGLILGATSSSVSIAGTTGTVVNFGTLQTLGALANVALNGGGSVTNGAAGATGALITGLGEGIYINNAPGTVTNFGAIRATSATAGTGIALDDGGSVSNFGTVLNTDTAHSAVYFSGGGSLTNGRNGAHVGLISGAGTGVSVRGGVGTVGNSGTIKSATANGIYLSGGGSVMNQAGGVIAGHDNGVYGRGPAVTVMNSGLIETTGTLDGVYLRGGGTITNNAGAMIAGSFAGVALGQHGGTVTNRGVIKGVMGFDGGAVNSGANTLINFGTVASTVAGGVAVEMGSSVGLSKLLVVEKGAVFTGLVEGGGRGEIMFAATGAAAMGANISGFDTVALANGAPDGLTLTNANFSGVDGRLTVIGGNDGNTVNASTVTLGQLTIDGGGGADVLTGDADGNAHFVFTAAALTATDRITGSGFGNELDMTSAGTIAAGGVTVVETYRLANGGANTLTLVSGNFTSLPAHGLPITIYGGTGGNTIDGSALSLATDPLDIYGGAGADVLKGGAGNDIFIFTAANLTNTDKISGGGGQNELLLTTAGTVAANGVSAVQTYVLADGGANTLTLASGNFTGTGGTITVSDGNSGNTVGLVAGLPAADNLVVYAGSGLDKLTGGAGNDFFYAGGDTTMTGNGGANTFVFSAAGSNTITDFTAAASPNNAMHFISGTGFSLPGATATFKPLGSLFVEGSFTGSQRFAYTPATGNLYYSASGSTAGEHLVAHLTGDPTLSAAQIGHLLYAT